MTARPGVVVIPSDVQQLLAHAGVADPIDPAPREAVRELRRDRRTAANELVG